MRVLLVLGVVVLLGVTLAVAYLYSQRPSQRALPPGRDAGFKNHQDMARWIERAMHDDLVRASLPAAEQERARRLLGEFFGDPPNELP